MQVRRISQTAAGELAGVHQNTWSDWEKGRKSPRVETALRLELLTDGLCPVEAWCKDARLRERWRARVRGAQSSASSAPARRRARVRPTAAAAVRRSAKAL